MLEKKTIFNHVVRCSVLKKMTRKRKTQLIGKKDVNLSLRLVFSHLGMGKIS